MSELIVRHCAPTLAGLKTGSLFTSSFESREQLTQELRWLNRTFVPKGLRAVPLRYDGKRALIYVYRPDRLRQDLLNEDADELLRQRGYQRQEPSRCVAKLAEQMRSGEEFPHEVGLFLGYPPEDVKGFIEKRSDWKCVGTWKVYGNEQQAMRTFEQYRKCTRVYHECYRKNGSIDRLVVKR